MWERGFAFPFVHPPADAPALGVSPAILDEAWLRVNHPHLPSIYPPLAQLTFALAAGAGDVLGGSHLGALKAALIGFELAGWWLLARARAASGRPPQASLALGACPLAILEIAREGHSDAIAIFGLALGAYGFAAARPRLGWGGFALAALAKLNGLIALLPAVRGDRRGLLWPGLPLLALLVAPFLWIGADAGTSLAAYATRWRSGDGAFSLVLAAAERILGGDWARIGGVTVTRHQLARVLTALAFGGAAIVLLRGRPSGPQIPARAALLLLLLLLLAPTLHPWYPLWLLPLLCFAPTVRAAGVALISLAPLLHHATWLELERGQWIDLAPVRAAVHLPVWALLALGWRRGDPGPEPR
jgi:hypothetical protein